MSVKITNTEDEKELEVRITNFYENILNIIEVQGWYAVDVGPDMPGNIPNFIYTVGLYSSFGKPEIFISGLPHGIDRKIINYLANKLSSPDYHIELFTKIDNLFENSPAMFIPLPNEKTSILHVANKLYEDNFKVYQLVWSDSNGVFPWEDEFSKDLKDSQYIIGNINKDLVKDN